MPDNVIVRPFRSSDAESLIALWREVFPASQPWHDSTASLCRKRNRFDNLIFVAISDDRLVGGVMAGYDGVRGWIYSLSVVPDQRRNGIGRMLMEHAETELRRLGCPKINLQIRGDNAEVKAFYRRIGFQQEDRASFGKALSSEITKREYSDQSIVVSDEIHLSPVVLSDRDACLRYLNETDEFFSHTAAIPFPYRPFDADQWLMRSANDAATNGAPVNWAIRRNDHQLIGTIGLINLAKGKKSEVGYWLAKPFWGQGIMTDVVRAFCLFAFENFELQRISARVFATNPASSSVLKKAGFDHEGTLRNEFFREDEPVDVLWYGLLREDLSRLEVRERDENSIDECPTRAEAKFVDDRIDKYNVEQTGRDDCRPLQMVIRDGNSKVVAGLTGLTVLDWFYVSTLWVDQNHRRNGLGARLLKAAENRATERGCIGACLSTFTFQAPDFYRGLGYECCGQIDDYPIGQSLFFMKKKLRKPPSSKRNLN